MKRFAAALAALAALAVIAPPAVAGGGCRHGAEARSEKGTVVTISQACFQPAILWAPENAPVTFVNADEGIEHNVFGVGIWVALETFTKGARHTVRFDRPGIYPYQCTLHPGMSGAIVVGDPSAPASAQPLDVDLTAVAPDPPAAPSIEPAGSAAKEPVSSTLAIAVLMSAVIAAAIGFAAGRMRTRGAGVAPATMR